MASLLDMFVCPAHTSVEKSLSSVVCARVSESYRGGNKIACVAAGRTALSLDHLWDELLTSSHNTRTLKNVAIELANRFARTSLTELAVADPEVWAKESFEIATKIAYQNGALRGTPKGQRKECRKSPMRLFCLRLFRNKQEDCRSADDALGISAGDFSGANVS
jgi:hypothetical protein